jgi:bifunctional NMN adenylyltransferase/nudix hydrolase
MPGRGYYALPGGFVKPTETLVQAAVRSAEEKAGIILDKNLVYHSVVFDQPERSLRGRTITHTFLFKLGQDYTKALRNADWINVNQLFMYEEEIFEDHKLIIQSLV